ncbi:SIR2 family protein [Microvirga sesbaniae]|uniref:SIR2 family protein n=1 Tax=Microvirga sesbaniae TaxID=681392 RepID=UPI0021C933E0|nr:SIR2 family protein [Microvirga sp. HBU67692]
MKFLSNGPDIPDDLLVARDAGDVILFCGAGVSQQSAKLPNFPMLADRVVQSLGAALDSRARTLLKKASEIEPMPDIGGLVATDRVFGLLEQEFEATDVRAAVAEAIRPGPEAKLDAHRVLLDLATTHGVTRLVTTNFDLLFEACDHNLLSAGPPNLPDPHSDRDFRGIVHLHGRVDANYRAAEDEEFVVSSADFGRAYLSVGWATRFIQRLLSRYQILFVGYTADDPPVQYLLEGLNLSAGTRNRLYAFQSGEQRSAIALWEHRGVQAIPFDASQGFAPLWDTLSAWADRARDPRQWHEAVLSRASAGPQHLTPHERGQVAHILSTREGARRLATTAHPLGAEWILVADPAQRYANPERKGSGEEDRPAFDPFDALGLDGDPAPEPIHPDDISKKREAASGALDLLVPNLSDREQGAHHFRHGIRGSPTRFDADLPPRLLALGSWMSRKAHEPVVLWWAAQQPGLHPSITRDIERRLLRDTRHFPDAVRRGWRLLLAAWRDQRVDPMMRRYNIELRGEQEGWTHSLVRDLVHMYRPKLIVGPAFSHAHPLLWASEGLPDDVIHVHVDYPRPHQGVAVPDEFLPYAVDCFRENLDLALALEREISGSEWVYLAPSRGPEGCPEESRADFELTGLLALFQKLLTRLASVNCEAALSQVRSWSTQDNYVFARLRIWAAGTGLLSVTEAGAVFLTLSEQAFWDPAHQRDLLYALKDRWPELLLEDRTALERRLLTGSYPRNADSVRSEEVETHARMDRLQWLSSHGVTFTFDISETLRALGSAAPQWTPRSGDAAADSSEPEVFSITTDSRPDSIRETPIPQILPRAEELRGYDFTSRTERDPFRGLAEQKPVRALGALTHAARSGVVQRWAWSAFLHAEGRTHDRLRMIRAIAARLGRLPPDRLEDIAYPVSEWMKAVSDRFYTDAAEVLPSLWTSLMVALRSAGTETRRRDKRSWAYDALNAPVGKLCDLLFKDPAKDNLAEGIGFPRHWTNRFEDLLALPGDMRRHSLVMLAHQLSWLFAIDPHWTEQHLLAHVGDEGPDGDAIWDGILWSQRVSRALYPAVKDALVTRTRRSRRREESTVLAGLLLIGWSWTTPSGEPLVSDVELREVLIHADDQFRQHLLWHLERWCSEPVTDGRDRVIPFFANVWPKQRALRTPEMSAHLANFALVSGDLMPRVVQLILPRLVPARGTPLRLNLEELEPDGHPVIAHPSATLDLLWAVLGEDTAAWPYRIEPVLDVLAQMPETASDARLSELRRRLDLP